MMITVSFFGPVKRPWPEHSRRLEAAENSTVAGVLASFGYSQQDMRRLAVVVNGKRAGLDQALRDGDEVRLVLLAGGG